MERRAQFEQDIQCFDHARDKINGCARGLAGGQVEIHLIGQPQAHGMLRFNVPVIQLHLGREAGWPFRFVQKQKDYLKGSSEILSPERIFLLRFQPRRK